MIEMPDNIRIECVCDDVTPMWMGIGGRTKGHERRRVLSKSCECKAVDDKIDVDAKVVEIKEGPIYL